MQISYLLTCCLLVSLSSVQALYDASSDVQSLTDADFNSRVIQSDQLWLVEFYAPWCGHCQRLAPEWSKAANSLKGIVNVGAVDMDKYPSVGGPYNVQGFPTIKIFGADKSRPTDYNGARTSQAIVEHAFNALRDMTQKRTGGGSSGSSGGSGSNSDSTGSGSNDVVEVTDGNFEEKVINSKEIWLVEFYAPWCGHCKNLAPEWARAATRLKGKVNLAAMDATANNVIAQKYEIKGFPTIKFFPAGKKDFSSAEEYTGGRTASDIVNWAEEKYAEVAEPPEIVQLVSAEVFDETCKNKQLCVISFLPDILDTGASGRNEFIQMLSGLGEKFKRKPWGWLWSAAGAQSKLEASVGVGGYGYPAMVALNPRKSLFAELKLSFSEQTVNEFLKELSYGRGSTAALRGEGLPEIATVESWDGKDGHLPEEEEFDLSELGIDVADKDEL